MTWTFQIFVYYSVFVLKAVSFSSATPAVDIFVVSGTNNTTSYSVNNRLNWFIAAVGDSGWEQSDDGIFTSNLSR